MEEFAFKPPCTAKVVGFWKLSKASDLVLSPLFDCSIDEICWKNAAKSISDITKTDQVHSLPFPFPYLIVLSAVI
jgi:hypothetical protein